MKKKKNTVITRRRKLCINEHTDIDCLGKIIKIKNKNFYQDSTKAPDRIDPYIMDTERTFRFYAQAPYLLNKTGKNY